MDLWIRSQDKKAFVKVNNIEMDTDFDNEDLYEIYGVSDGDKYLLGQYDSEEAAMTVIDEIQDLLVIKETIKDYYEVADIQVKTLILANMQKVYIMPQK